MINSVLKALDIMNVFSPDKPLLTLSEICEILPYPKTTLRTILKTLESRGFIECKERGVYSLGTAVIPLTQSVRVNVQLRDRAAPLLRELAEFCSESVYLTIMEGSECLYIYAIESSDRLLARSAIGDIMPMYCTSVGKAILSFLPEDEVNRIIEEFPLAPINVHTITDVEILKEKLQQGRQRGYSIDNEEHELGVYCLGAPIFNEKGEVFASCSVSGSDKQILGEKLEAYSAGLCYTAQEISRRMGFVPKGDTLLWRETINPLRENK